MVEQTADQYSSNQTINCQIKLLLFVLSFFIIAYFTEMSIVVIISWRGEMNMKKLNYHLYLTDDEYSQVIHSLIELKNKLIQAGKYTDVVDDLLVRLISAKKKNIKIRIKK